MGSGSGVSLGENLIPMVGREDLTGSLNATSSINENFEW